jgi:hypothetical protein
VELAASAGPAGASATERNTAANAHNAVASVLGAIRRWAITCASSPRGGVRLKRQTWRDGSGAGGSRPWEAHRRVREEQADWENVFRESVHVVG